MGAGASTVQDDDDDIVHEPVAIKKWVGPKPTASGGIALRPQRRQAITSGEIALKWTLVNPGGTNSEAPSSRSNHVSWFLDETERYSPGIAVFGGTISDRAFNEVHVLEASAVDETGVYVWQRLRDFSQFDPECSRRDTPISCLGASTVKVGQFCIVHFGGFDSLNSYTNDTHVFHTALRSWFPVRIEGELPRGRRGQAMAAHLGKVLIHGGYDGSGTSSLAHADDDAYLNDLAELDCSTLLHFQTEKAKPKGNINVVGGDDNRVMWTTPKIPLRQTRLRWVPTHVKSGRFIPSARSGHTMIAIPSKGKMGRYFMFGGVGPGLAFSAEQVLIDEYVRQNKTTGEASRRYRFREIRTVGAGPAARAGHSCVLVAHTHILIFGGRDARRTLNDVMELELRTQKWTLVTGTGNNPSPRYDHSACHAVGTKFFIFGGFESEAKGNLADTWLCELIRTDVSLPVPINPDDDNPPPEVLVSKKERPETNSSNQVFPVPSLLNSGLLGSVSSDGSSSTLAPSFKNRALLMTSVSEDLEAEEEG